MEILIASNNLHKTQELETILDGVKLRTPKALGLAFDHDETAHTFWENALGKARTLQAMVPTAWVVADDSGLCVNALNGAPGVYSARYGSQDAGRVLSDKEKNDLVLKLIAGTSDRGAHFVCTLALVGPGDRFFIIQETWPGIIGQKALGDGGFGYDPIFYLPELNRSCAQLSPEEKNVLSHRGRAGRRLRALINDLKIAP